MQRDIGSFPRPGTAVDVQVYIGITPVGSVGNYWQCWTKPNGVSMVHIFALSSGSGGGGGFSRAAGNPGGGGGGGASGGQSSLLIPAMMLPDQLFMYVPNGGAGVTSGAGTAGEVTYVAMYPASTGLVTTNMVLAAASGTGGGGGTGTAGAVGSAGSAAGASTLAAGPFAGPGFTQFLAGQSGTAGGAVAGAAGGALTIVATGLRCTGGTGGGGTTNADFAGGGVTAITNSYLSANRPIAAAAGSNPGSSGYASAFQYWPSSMPFFFWGGLGGGSSNTGVGGPGGKGGFGGGGGGGGAGTTGGRGGDGGSGVVVITCW